MKAESLRIPLALVAIVVFILLTQSDDESDSPTVYERDGRPPVINVPDDDPEMKAAIEKARATVDQFIRAIADPQPTQEGFALKMVIGPTGTGEHVWLSDVTFADGTFTGTLNNEPANVTSVKLGDTLKVAKDEISDWMYMEDGKIVGGFTVRVLYERMSPEQRRKFGAPGLDDAE